MIQRIQTVYLLIIVTLMAAVMLTPLATLYSQGATDQMTAFGVKTVEQLSSGGVNLSQGGYSARTTIMGILIAACALLPLVTIFLFKNRFLQIRLCVVEIILLLGAQVMMAVYLIKAYSVVNHPSVEGNIAVNFTVAVPIVCAILSYLAFKAIIKDEALVRSLNRIR